MFLSHFRNRKTPDTTEPTRIIEEAKAASERSQTRSDFIEIIATRMQTRVEENHFGESLVAAWKRREA